MSPAARIPQSSRCSGSADSPAGAPADRRCPYVVSSALVPPSLWEPEYSMACDLRRTCIRDKTVTGSRDTGPVNGVITRCFGTACSPLDIPILPFPTDPLHVTDAPPSVPRIYLYHHLLHVFPNSLPMPLRTVLRATVRAAACRDGQHDPERRLYATIMSCVWRLFWHTLHPEGEPNYAKSSDHHSGAFGALAAVQHSRESGHSHSRE